MVLPRALTRARGRARESDRPFFLPHVNYVSGGNFFAWGLTNGGNSTAWFGEKMSLLAHRRRKG